MIFFKGDQHLFIERKNNLKHLFKGQLYQLWAQYFCMIEMGYKVESIAFYEISTNKMMYQTLPTENNKIESYTKHFSMEDSIIIFNVSDNAITKYGNAIHRDKDIVFL